MREIRLNPDWDVPQVDVVLSGRNRKTARAKLVFDTGSAISQLDVELIEALGYSVKDAMGISGVKGATGESVQGYIIRMSSLFLLGHEFKDVLVLTYDFKNFPGLDGLLGWDVIQNLDVEMNGPERVLKVF